MFRLSPHSHHPYGFLFVKVSVSYIFIINYSGIGLEIPISEEIGQRTGSIERVVLRCPHYFGLSGEYSGI